MNASAPPSFYMRSEYGPGTVRACRILGRVAGPRPSGYWHVAVDPPLVVGGMPDPDEILLAERWENTDLGRLRDDEVLSVYVCVIENPAAVRSGTVRESDMRLVTWADVARDASRLT